MRENEILDKIGIVLRGKGIKFNVRAKGFGKKKSEIYVDSKHIEIVQEILSHNQLENSIDVLDKDMLKGNSDGR